ncbi:hypothetical protein BDW22DRAFT_603753 [Trametopsis cervina]|nr:hypothetical protein BDW22DRAFT_603753 [Trametopsis cervina]
MQTLCKHTHKAAAWPCVLDARSRRVCRLLFAVCCWHQLTRTLSAAKSTISDRVDGLPAHAPCRRENAPVSVARVSACGTRCSPVAGTLGVALAVEAEEEGRG